MPLSEDVFAVTNVKHPPANKRRIAYLLPAAVLLSLIHLPSVAVLTPT